MKWILILFLVVGIFLISPKDKSTVEKLTDDESPVAWLREAHTGEKEASVEIGSFFVTERNTVYGADCIGCTVLDGVASMSSQIEVTVESVRQSDGTWLEGITYDGYYLIASDKALPMCTVVRISEHSYSGQGLKPDVPFEALVVDRGSMIQENTIDLFAGSELKPLVTHDKMDGAVVEVIGFLDYRKNEFGQMSCAGQ